MHCRLAQLVDLAQARRAQLLAAVEATPEARREHRVDPECWSVAEVLEHLHRVERGIVRLSEHALQQARAHGLGPEQSDESVLGALDQFEIPRRVARVSAPERVMPSGRFTAVEMVAKLAESRRALLASVAVLDGLALGQIAFPHPLLGQLNLYQWLLFLGQHEARHTAQIEEITSRLGHPSEPDTR